MLVISRHLFQRWNEESVQYCIWKGNEHLDEGLNGQGDVDVLLDKEVWASGTNILREVGYKEFFALGRKRSRYAEDWIGFDYATGKLIHIHIHIHLHRELFTIGKNRQEILLPWSLEVLDNRILDLDSGLYIICPEQELFPIHVRMAITNQNTVNIESVHKFQKNGYTF